MARIVVGIALKMGRSEFRAILGDYHTILIKIIYENRLRIPVRIA
jgi:hypothetical protein